MLGLHTLGLTSALKMEAVCSSKLLDLNRHCLELLIGLLVGNSHLIEHKQPKE